MIDTTIAGVDPGIVHTGVVVLRFDQDNRELFIDSDAVPGLNVESTKNFLASFNPDKVFIEAYRPRSNFSNDPKMGAAVRDLKAAIPNSVSLDNTGVTKIITREIMEALGVWRFVLRTHHQDLRSAARIMLYGMVKDEEYNKLLTDVIIRHIDNDNPWRVK